MCFYLAWGLKKGKMDFDNDGKIICYKILALKNKKLYPYYRTDFGSIRVKDPYISNRKNIRISRREREDKKIKYGIHVFTSYSRALDFVKFRHSSLVIYSAICYKKDFVAVNHIEQEAVFMKIQLKKRMLIL